MNYICHSGGCPGSDMFWENEGYKHGVKTIAYSFGNHVQESKNQKVLTTEELNEGYKAVEIADKTLKRFVNRLPYPYVKNLLSRNWFQVKNAETVFAISRKFISRGKFVDGGTGWAVQMAVDNKKPIFVFDQKTNKWHKFNYETNAFDVIDYVPKLTENFAGVGTRELSDDGKKAIQMVYENTFGCIV